MCGIIGYTGHRPAVQVIIEGLRKLEYRGYDSAGIAIANNQNLDIIKAEGKLHALEEKLFKTPHATATTAMGHTRWATHGIPSIKNAHPHISNDQTLALVHNGIIENFQELKDRLIKKGFNFYSETDTEVLINLISDYKKQGMDLLNAFACALKEAKGAYAVCLMDKNEPNRIYAARMAAPLIFGLGSGEFFIASDIPAFLTYTRNVIFLEDREIITATPNDYQILHLDDLTKIERNVITIEWDMQSAQKGGYKHFMLKEIFEQPKVITDALAGRIDKNNILLPELDNLPIPERLYIIACGTSWHAGLWSKHIFEKWAQIPVHVEIASEFRYREKLLLQKNDYVLVISQSGETADTLAALRKVNDYGIKTIGLCNVLGSSIARESQSVIYTQAGPEISVASTKAMTSQMIALTLITLYFGLRKKTITDTECLNHLKILLNLSNMLNNSLSAMHDKAKELSRKYAQAHNFFYLGRGHAFALALEGALKLKELSYIHAEGYASGEMKHGPIALIDPQFPTFAIALDDDLLPKVKSNIVEVKARQGNIIVLTNNNIDFNVDDTWLIPKIDGPLSAFIALPALQLFSYEMADYLGKDVDQPRNLAKSVTVE